MISCLAVSVYVCMYVCVHLCLCVCVPVSLCQVTLHLVFLPLFFLCPFSSSSFFNQQAPSPSVSSLCVPPVSMEILDKAQGSVWEQDSWCYVVFLVGFHPVASQLASSHSSIMSQNVEVDSSVLYLAKGGTVPIAWELLSPSQHITMILIFNFKVEKPKQCCFK